MLIPAQDRIKYHQTHIATIEFLSTQFSDLEIDVDQEGGIEYVSSEIFNRDDIKFNFYGRSFKMMVELDFQNTTVDVRDPYSNDWHWQLLDEIHLNGNNFLTWRWANIERDFKERKVPEKVLLKMYQALLDLPISSLTSAYFSSGANKIKLDAKSFPDYIKNKLIWT